MTVADKRTAVVSAVKSREGRNTYTQGSKRDQVASGWSDCSSLTRWAYEQIGIDIGDNTEAQMVSKQLYNVVVPIDAGVPRESYLLPGDLLYFRGRDTRRKATQYVGHVEMYMGGGELSGHGSGIGPTRKNMVNYCKQRQASSSPVPAGNRGLICVRRAVALIEEDPQSDQDYVASLYRDLLGREPDAAGAAGWVAVLQGGASRESVRQAFYGSEEYKRLHGEPETPAEGEVELMRDLTRGDKGYGEIATLQRCLKSLGYYGGKIDHSFGAGTEAAVKAFQSARRIAVNYPGTVGPKTWTVLLTQC